jgi:hypothetical protein
MDPGTHEDPDTSKHITTGASTYHTDQEPSPAYDSALAHLCLASQTTYINKATGAGNVLLIASEEASLPNVHRQRDHPQDKAARSISYTHIVSIFHHKDRGATTPTPPLQKKCNLNSPSATLDELHSFMICEALVPANSEDAPPPWIPRHLLQSVTTMGENAKSGRLVWYAFLRILL